MFIKPTITWVTSEFSRYIWLDTKIVLKKKIKVSTKFYLSDCFKCCIDDLCLQALNNAGAPRSFGKDVVPTPPAGTLKAKKIYHASMGHYHNDQSLKVCIQILFTQLNSTS